MIPKPAQTQANVSEEWLFLILGPENHFVSGSLSLLRDEMEQKSPDHTFPPHHRSEHLCGLDADKQR